MSLDKAHFALRCLASILPRGAAAWWIRMACAGHEKRRCFARREILNRDVMAWCSKSWWGSSSSSLGALCWWVGGWVGGCGAHGPPATAWVCLTVACCPTVACCLLLLAFGSTDSTSHTPSLLYPLDRACSFCTIFGENPQIARWCQASLLLYSPSISLSRLA